MMISPLLVATNSAHQWSREAKILIVRAGRQNLARNASAELAAGDRNDVAIPPLARADLDPAWGHST